MAKQRSQLVSTEYTEAAFAELARVTRTRMMAIVPRLIPEILGETSRVVIQAKIEKACKEALADLAKGPPRREFS